jgi:hypothetical protein
VDPRRTAVISSGAELRYILDAVEHGRLDVDAVLGVDDAAFQLSPATSALPGCMRASR